LASHPHPTNRIVHIKLENLQMWEATAKVEVSGIVFGSTISEDSYEEVSLLCSFEIRRTR